MQAQFDHNRKRFSNSMLRKILKLISIKGYLEFLELNFIPSIKSIFYALFVSRKTNSWKPFSLLSYVW
jgi:hypothetical protein